MGGKLRRAGAKNLRIERLEERLALANTPIINEFMASNSQSLVDGDGGHSDWIEIYNPTNAPVNLAGWRLTDNVGNLSKWTFPGVTLNAGAYLIVFASSQSTSNYVDAGGYQHTNFALSAGGEYLGLVDPNGVVASAYPDELPQSANISYGLNSLGQGAFFSHPTPGGANDDASALSRGIVISEIMFHPSSELVTEEYIEIYNGEAAAVNLGGWTLAGGVEMTLPAVALAPGQYLVVAANAAGFAAKYPAVTNYVAGWTGKLSNSSDAIQLRDDNGQQVDAVTYFDEGAWATREVGPLDLNHTGWVWSDAADGGGSSLELVGSAPSNDWGQNWQASTVVDGTPGAANSTADLDGNVAPMVLNVSHTPIIPRSTDPVVIRARLVDESSVGLGAMLFWRVDGAASFTSTVMTDDGSGSDTTAGDQVFTAELPPMSSGTIVEFYIQSSDQAGNLRTYPPPSAPGSQQRTNLLYQVDNSFTGTLPGANDAPIYRLIMTNAERLELAQIGSTPSESESNARMNGSFVSVTPAGVTVRYQVGIRNRGNGSADMLPNSYHLDFPRDAPWNGLEAINFNTQHTQVQLAGLKLFQKAGYVAEDSARSLVRVNGVNLAFPGIPSYGIYMSMEAADDVFASNHFPEDDEGNLYRAIRDPLTNHAYGDFRYLGPSANAYKPFYDKETNTSEADFSDIVELISVLNLTPNAEYYAKLSQIVDVDQWLGYFAMMAILGTEESSLATGGGDDYFLYRGENDPRFSLIPHDLDSILAQGQAVGSATSSIYRAAGSVALSRFFAHPLVRPAYHDTLKRLLETTFAKPEFDPFVDALLGPFAPAQKIADMKTFMDARRTYIMGLINAPLTVVSPLSTSGGYPKTPLDAAALSGVAPLAGTHSVTAAGMVVAYNHTTGAWTAPAVPLKPGINRIEVRAHDGAGGSGKMLASKTIDIWYDDGNVQNVSTNITADTTWTAAGGPYVLTADVAVVGPATLTIEPGATVFFNSPAGLTVRDGGRIVAEGTEHERIRFTRNPATFAASWDGLTFINTTEDNRLAYIDMQGGASSGQALLLTDSRLLIDHAAWFDINAQVLNLVRPSIIIRNSNIPAISGGETVRLAGVIPSNEFVFENNIVGINSSGGDVVDVGHVTLTPPTIYFRGNTFLGGGDDGIDTDGFPVVIENNTFQNFHKSANSSGSTTSNAVSTGHVTVSGQEISSNLTLRNNIFFNNDHHLLLKDFSFATLVNNTMVDATIGAINFAEPGGGSSIIGPGLGANIDGNIFWGTGLTLQNFTAQNQLALNRSIVPASLVTAGVGNIAADPLLVNPAGGNFSVKRGSLAIGAGPNGSDIGAVQTPRYAPASAANLKVTELHYHPLPGDKPGGEIGGDAEYFEFIELQNISGETIDLTDVAFTGGVQFAYPWLASLAPGQTTVLVNNRDLFESRYGAIAAVAGEYAGAFANSGETVRLVDRFGDTIAEFAYSDEGSWPDAADGDGPSLQIVSVLGSPAAGINWMASAVTDGTPGAAPLVAFDVADFDLDGHVNGNDFLHWQRGLGKSVPNGHIADGDSDGDRDVDAADLATWRTHFGPPETAAAAIAAEEPASRQAVDYAELVDAAMATMLQDASPQGRFRPARRATPRGYRPPA
jgi:hypothetical protein